MAIYVTHCVLSIPSVGIVISGGGGCRCSGFLLGWISIMKMMTTTKDERVTAKHCQERGMARGGLRTNGFSHIIPFDFLHICPQIADTYNNFIKNLLQYRASMKSSDKIVCIKQTSMLISCCFRSALASFFLLSSSIWILRIGKNGYEKCMNQIRTRASDCQYLLSF